MKKKTFFSGGETDENSKVKTPLGFTSWTQSRDPFAEDLLKIFGFKLVRDRVPDNPYKMCTREKAYSISHPPAFAFALAVDLL